MRSGILIEVSHGEEVIFFMGVPEVERRQSVCLHYFYSNNKVLIEWLVHALAAELRLDIYIFSLAKIGLDDAVLGNLIARLPPRSIALIEGMHLKVSAVTKTTDKTPM